MSKESLIKKISSSALALLNDSHWLSSRLGLCSPPHDLIYRALYGLQCAIVYIISLQLCALRSEVA